MTRVYIGGRIPPQLIAAPDSFRRQAQWKTETQRNRRK